MSLENLPASMRAEIEQAREELVGLHHELVRNNLVTWTSGNVSVRITGTERQQDLMVIKPSGVSYDDLTAPDMVVTDLHGNVVDGVHAPSSDTFTHAYVYRTLPEVHGQVHTHSTYATAWAARAEEIPCVLTAMADEFGGPIPVGPFARIGDEEIGQGIVQTLQFSRSPAVLMQNHGVFTIGKNAKAAVKAAVMCEDVARTVHLSRQLGTPVEISAEDITLLYERYQNVYGQGSSESK